MVGDELLAADVVDVGESTPICPENGQSSSTMGHVEEL
jgi:hypothetical protein